MTTQSEANFSLSFAHSDEMLEFADPSSAGAAFAAADGELGPRVISTRGGGARTIARSMRTSRGFAKAAPALSRLLADPSDPDRAFWLAYHGALSGKAA